MVTLYLLLIVTFTLSAVTAYLIKLYYNAMTELTVKHGQVATLMEQLSDNFAIRSSIREQLEQMTVAYEDEVTKNAIILSQKKSSETRLGMISENLVPLLAQLPYDPKNLHHLGQPIDYVYFDYEAAEIVFLEVKSGNSKESPRQKLIRNIVKAGKVHYEELRINEKGLKIKRVANE